MVKPNDQVADIASALAWLMDHADEYKIARDRIVLLGYSSGAHLVAFYSVQMSVMPHVKWGWKRVKSLLRFLF